MSKTISKFDDTIDVRDIISRVEELRGEEPDVDTAEFEAWPISDEALELAELEAILADLEGNGGDEQWQGSWYPVTLIRDSYFQDHAKELVEDCENLGNVPSYVEIDWEATARNVRLDYTSTEIDGVTYWYR